MDNCPVCNLQCSEDTRICSQCGWEFSDVIGEMSDEQKAVYKQRVKIMQKNWQKLQKSTTAHEPVIPSPLPTGYDTNTKVPELKRHPFDYPEEFRDKINQYPPVPAGEGTLNAEKYDIRNKLFPLEVTWQGWLKPLEGAHLQSAPLHIEADRDTARAIYQSGQKYPVFAKLKADADEKVTVALIELFTPKGAFAIKGGTTGGKTAVGVVEAWVEPVTRMEFVYMPGGRFMMGDTFGDGNNNEKPAHEVELDGFYIGKSPVTQGQWTKVMGSNPSYFKKGDNYPVETVSWDDAKAFIKKLTEMNSNKFQLRLPTEAEWEYACRSGGKKERYAGGDDVDKVAWHSGNSGNTTHAVGTKAANCLGIYDMSGNVWEWCEDIYAADAYSKHSGNNPIYATGGANRVVRGGGWDSGPGRVRCARRSLWAPALRCYDVGFRLLRTL